MAPNGMVTSPHALALLAGVDVLRAGGSAVDAAIATAAALAVLDPHMTGVGGDAFWLIHDAKTGQVHYLDGGGRAAVSGTIEAFKQKGLSEIPFRGILPATLTTPGAVASWCEAHAAYGKLPLARSLQTAIGYARDGFPVIEMLNLLEPLELHKKPYPDHVHLLVQAKQIAYNDRDRHLADPAFAEVPTERLISKAYADERRPLMDPARALPWDKVPSYGSLTGDTVFIAVVDAEGNAVSLIHSLYGVFGSAVVAGNTGVVLQNRSAYFSLDPAHPNRLEPGKTPLHTLIASLGFRNDKLWSVVGCMGADGQPQIHLQTYVALMDYGCDMQEALEMPRWLSGRFALGESRDTLHIEARFPPETLAELERRGHQLNRWGNWNELAGHAHGITIDPESGLRCGGSDPRSDGAAIGY